MLRVEVTEDDVFDVFVPLVVGNVPLQTKALTLQAPSSSSSPLYRQAILAHTASIPTLFITYVTNVSLQAAAIGETDQHCEAGGDVRLR